MWILEHQEGGAISQNAPFLDSFALAHRLAISAGNFSREHQHSVMRGKLIHAQVRS